MQDIAFASKKTSAFQVSVSSLTLGSLYEAILSFSGHDRFETFWPSVCQNARWLIPSRRMGVFLCTGDGGFEIAGMFGAGKFQRPEQPRYVPCGDRLSSILSRNQAQWFTDPWEQFHDDADQLITWLLEDRPDLLFILPIRVKRENIGGVLFVMDTLSESDRSMLTTLGTIYTLHVGMTFELIRINEERERMQHQLVMQEKMASLGNLVAGIAHEVNNPIGAINSAADVAARCIDGIAAWAAQNAQEKDPKLHKFLELLRRNNQMTISAGERVSHMVKSLRNFARLDEAEFKRADLHEGLESTLILVQHELHDRIEIVKKYGNIPPLPCFPNQLNQVFMNLIVNALQATGEQGTITIETTADAERAYVRIADTGRGIPPEHLERIFDPGFTTKGVGVGTGLGLSICYNTVEKHQGTISVDSQVGRGTSFTLSLPLDRIAAG